MWVMAGFAFDLLGVAGFAENYLGYVPDTYLGRLIGYL